MIFSAPMFLYLLPAAGLPVLFHFFLKQKKREILFPTLMFFYRTDPRLNSRRKIHQLLLLLMRILLIAFILLALSRPRFQSSAAIGGKISVVAVVDNSGSMSDAAGGDKTKLELAVEGARGLVSALGQSARMSIVTLVEDPAVTSSNSLTSDKESLLSSLGEITPTAATGNAQRALGKAFKLLDANSASGGVVHVFSDLQESEWIDDALGGESADASIKIYLHRIESQTRKEANVAISSIQFPQQKILPRHPVKIGVVCRNNSQATATIRLNSVDDQENRNTQQVVLEPGRAQTIEVAINPEASGHHWVRTWIEGDGFSADNAAAIGIVCGRTATVLFGGSRDEFGVLPTAFSPDNCGQFTGMISKFGPLSSIPQAEGEEPILIVTTWQEIRLVGQNSAALKEYVEAGGNLLVVPSLKRISAKGKPPDFLGANTKTRMSHPRGVRIEALGTDCDFWSRIREATGTVSLGGASVLTFYPLALSEGFTPLLAASFDRVILAHKKLGAGNIYTSGTAFDPRWNTLPLTGLIVVMAQTIAVEGTSLEQDSMVSLVAGETPERINTGAQQAEFLSLTGNAIEWKGPANEMPAFSKSGVYLVKSGDKEYCVSVRSSDKEGLTQFVAGSHLPALDRITHEIVDYDPAKGFEKYHHGQNRTFNLFLPLLLLATLALLVEGWLANPRRARSQETSRSKGTPQTVRAGQSDSRRDKPNPQVLVSGGAG
ncbi:MAG: BatA and WFA domain-containing protein [Phycisphaerae bacterium]|nr:BatA and WFA domain-containing protein [Phycisphaerae bacterium]